MPSDTSETGKDHAPVVYDADGNPLKVRLVNHECAGDVSGEGHYGYVDEENGAHRSLYFEEAGDPEPEPGMKPHELFQLGSDKNVCRECGEGFQTWRGAWDHQHEQHDGYHGIEIDFSETEDWIDDTETFDWWVSKDHGEETERVELELWKAADLEDKGLIVHLAEPIRGGPA